MLLGTWVPITTTHTHSTYSVIFFYLFCLPNKILIILLYKQYDYIVTANMNLPLVTADMTEKRNFGVTAWSISQSLNIILLFYG